MRLRLSFILLNHIVVCSSWCEIHKKINFLGHMSILSTVYNYKKNYESEIWWNISLLFLLKILRDFFSEPCIACLFAGYLSLLKLHPICFLKLMLFIRKVIFFSNHGGTSPTKSLGRYINSPMIGR